MIFQVAIIFFKDILFPHKCFCGKLDQVLCEDCYQTIPKNKKELCPLCRKLSENGKTCNTCRGKSYLTGVMQFGKHESLLKDAIWRFKYESIIDLAEPLSNLFLEKYSDFIESKNFIITNVPISKSRQSWRGYNQAAELAKSLALKSGQEHCQLLSKEEVGPQVGLSKKARARNIKDKIHALDEHRELQNTKILIVDDVYTTGSTLEECAKVLREQGAKEVWGLVLSRD